MFGLHLVEEVLRHPCELVRPLYTKGDLCCSFTIDCAHSLVVVLANICNLFVCDLTALICELPLVSYVLDPW